MNDELKASSPTVFFSEVILKPLWDEHQFKPFLIPIFFQLQEQGLKVDFFSQLLAINECIDQDGERSFLRYIAKEIVGFFALKNPLNGLKIIQDPILMALPSNKYEVEK